MGGGAEGATERGDSRGPCRGARRSAPEARARAGAGAGPPVGAGPGEGFSAESVRAGPLGRGMEGRGRAEWGGDTGWAAGGGAVSRGQLEPAPHGAEPWGASAMLPQVRTLTPMVSSEPPSSRAFVVGLQSEQAAPPPPPSRPREAPPLPGMLKGWGLGLRCHGKEGGEESKRIAGLGWGPWRRSSP